MTAWAFMRVMIYRTFNRVFTMKFATSTVQTSYQSPLGIMLLAASEKQVAGIWFAGQRHQPDSSHWARDDQHPLLQRVKTELAEYFAGQRHAFDLPLNLECGTAFQQSVWRALLALPYGSSSSYGALSTVIGKTSAVRALGAAVGRNPFSIVVPCHRVIGAKGALTGYAGGLERKAALLKIEGVL
jgi:methylated-DNA-[protein]-cysteine S-methyltransferase